MLVISWEFDVAFDVGGLQVVDCQRVAKLEEFGSSMGFQNLFHLFLTQMQVHLQRDCL
jgi:hypothetical protein